MTDEQPTKHGWFFPKHMWVEDSHEHRTSLFGVVERHCTGCSKRERRICDYEYPVEGCRYYGA